MTDRVKANRHFLKYISHCGASQRKALLRSAAPDEIRSLCECVINAYSKTVPLPQSVKEKLKPFKKSLISIGKSPRRMTTRSRKRLLSQRGGAFLPILLSSLLPAV